MPNNVPPDELYFPSREDLLLYEDSSFNALIQAVANYYTTRNDQSTWGNFLRALAIEMGRLNYYYSYDVVNKTPSYLTPADIRRRWADPLYVSSAYPTQTQFDTDFKTMLVELIAAYQQGSTVSGIQAVIFAYTGINIQVEELYKQIGNGVFDQSDRNAIKVSVSVGNNSLSEITTLTQLQQIVNSLYGAIDLAKPAHVGLEFTTIFGEGDNIDCFISPSRVTQQQYLSLTPAQQALYTATAYVLVNPPVFWLAGSPLSNPVALNTILRDSNGNLQLAIGSGVPGITQPTWNTASNGTTVDGSVTWNNISPPVTSLSLTNNVVTVTVTNYFTLGQQVTLLNLSNSDGFSFLNGQQLSVLTSDGVTFQAAFTHIGDVSSTPQVAGTVSFLPAASVTSTVYATLSPTYQSLYQQQYSNTNCASSGITDTLRIFIRQIEQPPEDPMLIMAPVLNQVLNPPSPPDGNKTFEPVVPPNPTTEVTAWAWRMKGALTVGQYNALPTITFAVVNTVADGANAGYTFNALMGGPGVNLHEGMNVTIIGCRSAFNMTGRIHDVIINEDNVSGMFQLLLSQTIVSQAESGTGTVTPTLQSAYVLQAGQYVLLTDASLPPLSNPALNPPTKWFQIIDKPSNMPTGEVANWDITHPAGLVAPRLNQVWEISGGDNLSVFGLS